jgi:polysaccharide biosynthesis/export protein
MQHRRAGRVSAGIAAALAICAAGGGCNTLALGPVAPGGQERPAAQTTPAPSPGTPASARAAAPTGAFVQVRATANLLQPRSELFWAIEEGEPRKRMGGPAQVGPDGTVDLGPYGVFKVAGLTVEQARLSIERQLGRRVRNPKVQLRLTEVSSAAAWSSGTPTAQPQRQSPSASGVKSTWRPAQREEAPAALPLPRPENQVGAVTPPQPLRTAGWRPAGQSVVQTVGDKGPELGPAPRPVAPAAPEGVVVGPPVSDAPLGPPVGAPVEAMPGHAPGPIEGPPGGPVEGHLAGPVGGHLAGPPHPHHTPFGVGHAPNEGRKLALPRYVLAPPDILQIDSLEGLLTQPVRGPHLIRPDGTVSLGAYGEVFVAGYTLEQARVEIAKVIHTRLNPAVKTLKDVLDGLSVDVLAYNSRAYYVITNRLGFGQIVTRLPITGSETVLDALSQIQGIPPEATGRRIWVARKVPGHGGGDNILTVDWAGIAKRGEMQTNYQLLPGDRLFVQAEAVQQADYGIAKWLSPVQRVLGAILLGSQTVNSIQSGGLGGGR